MIIYFYFYLKKIIMNNNDDIINNCILIVNKYKNNYIPDNTVIDDIDNYYNNYNHIIYSIQNQFILYVKSKINNNDYLALRYNLYKEKELEYWFLDPEFKNLLKDLRKVSDLEYYLYQTNKINKNKIKSLEYKINYLLIIFIFITFLQIFNHISIY